MKITRNLPLPDLAALVSDACLKAGIDVVLSGGACVSIFTDNRYASYGLDLVLRSSVPKKRIRATMEALGFREDGRHFRHPDNPYIVEFLSPPLSVGEEPVKEILEIRRRGRTLRLLSPTDCVKDRLAAFYHWADRPSLEQAVLVCLAQDVDLKEVRRWSAKEGTLGKYQIFRDALAAASKMGGKKGE
jgi:hypothetical protein